MQKVSIKGLFKRHTKRIFYDPPPPFKLVIKGNLEIKCFFRLLSICFFKNNLSQCQLTESAPSFSLSVPSSCCPAANCSKAELFTLILYPVSNTWVVHFFKSSPPCLQTNLSQVAGPHWLQPAPHKCALTTFCLGLNFLISFCIGKWLLLQCYLEISKAFKNT